MFVSAEKYTSKLKKNLHFSIMQTYRCIGLMSGTSLDGLDIAYAQFNLDKQWSFELLSSKSVVYSDELKNKLEGAFQQDVHALDLLDKTYGEYLAQQVQIFLEEQNIQKSEVDFIASHGHTIFHEPQKGITRQIGCGKTMANILGLKVINDFRSNDVALGGQGAPLVPIGDQLLFHHYDACLNLGGFSNISFDVEHKRIAFDICPVNIALNLYAQQLGYAYDKGGFIAQGAKLNTALLERLNRLEYYQKAYPKSLGREWLEQEFLPQIDAKIPVQDILHTLVVHAAQQIVRAVQDGHISNILISGGGAYNTFLIDSIKALADFQVCIPSTQIIEFKEAIVFAFLGVLHQREEVNCLSSVTGATRDNIGGKLHLPT